MAIKVNQPSVAAVAKAKSVAARSALWSLAGAAGFCMLVALGAQVRIPLPGTPVPMTLQSTVVLLAGFALAPRPAAAAMLLYLGCGTLYQPFFAGSAGILGPTGGYLLGFVAAAWLVSVVKGSGRASIGRLLVAGTLGTAVILVLGVAVAAIWTGSIRGALAIGLVPFIAKAFVQLLVAVALARCVGGLRRKMSSRSACDY